MPKLSEADMRAILDAPRVLFLLDIDVPGMPEPLRVAQVGLVSKGLRYAELPIEFEPEFDAGMDIRALKVRGAGIGVLGQFLPDIDKTTVKISVVLDTAPDEPLHEYAATFWMRQPGEDRDVIGYLRLAS